MAIQAKVGDVVHMRGNVVKQGNGEIAIDFGELMAGVPYHHWVPDKSIVHVETAPLKVGDSVAWRGDAAKGTIIAIDSTTEPLMAWVRGGIGTNNYGILVFLDELERADEPRPLKVGDKVRHKESGRTSHVKGFWQNVHGVPMVLVLNDDSGKEDTFPIQFMERVE